MTQHRTRARGEDCRHPATIGSEDVVTNGVDAPVHGPQSPAFQSMGDRVPVDASIEELRARNYAVLRIGQGRDRAVDRRGSSFAPYNRFNRTRSEHASSIAPEAFRLTRRVRRLR
jgi:hypothetical protein